MKDIDFTTIRDRWVTEAADSDLGLWWLADDLREVLGEAASEEDVRSATVNALRPLLESGALRAVTLLDAGKFEVWPGGVDQQIARIVEGWRALGKPDIGDIVWFLGPRD